MPEFLDQDQFALSEDARALADEAIESAQAAAQAEQLKDNLASFVRLCWQRARDERQRCGVEERMRQSLRQRKGEYDPDKLAAIRTMSGSEIYMMITSVKCRAAAAWLRDVMTADGQNDRVWGVEPTPDPSLPDTARQAVASQVSAEVGYAVAGGLYPTREAVQERLQAAQRQLANVLRDKARMDAEDAERRIADVLVEGGFDAEMELFIDDLVTFPAAVMAGPLLRRRPRLQWVDTPSGAVAQTADEVVEEFERVSPFDFYPDPAATDIDDGFMLRRHRMSLADVQALRGSPGYDDAALDAVSEDYARGGLHEWMTLDQRTGEQAVVTPATDWTAPIDALEFWGYVPGAALGEWGLEGLNPHQMYQANVWLIGRHVIRAMLNADPLGRKPFAKACYEVVPGSFWGNGVPDLIRDVQAVCNAAARAMVNNMAIASGPQVWVNIDRVPPGTRIDEMYPWKVWQTTSDEMGSTAPPMNFFQPDMHASMLMGVFEKFAQLADEYSGIPRYMTGDHRVGGAAATASGLSMLMGNANKLMKQVVANMDRMLKDVIVRLHQHLLYRRQDPLIRGDVRIVVRGATTVTVKDLQQLRRQELLTQTANPIDMQILGLDGRAALWRENIKGLGMNPDDVIAPPEVIAERAAMAQMQQALPAPGAAPAAQTPGAAQPDPMMSEGGYPADMGHNF